MIQGSRGIWDEMREPGNRLDRARETVSFIFDGMQK
jgi:hypothetical protein